MKFFVSYRRDDSRMMTERICDRLSEFHGREAIFKDVDSLRISGDFRVSLKKAIGECDLFLAVIGNKWMGPDKNSRRIDDSGDFVRLEVEQALEEKIPIVPVLIDDTPMPLETELPASLKPLTFIQATRMRGDPDFRSDFDRLATLITEHVIDKLISIMITGTQPPSLSFDQNPMVDEVNKVIVSDPYNTRALLWRASLGKGYSVTPGGSASGFQIAIADYRRVREIDSNLADGFFGLADLYYMAAVFDLVIRRRYRVLKKGKLGSNPETGLADMDNPIIEPLPDKDSRAVFATALSQLVQGLSLEQTTGTMESGVKMVFAPNIGQLMANIRSILGLELPTPSDETLSYLLTSLVAQYDYEAIKNIF
jgi:TIR domain-containing protein